MGWPIKGSERSYDSLSGTADIIGAEAMEPKTAALLVDTYKESDGIARLFGADENGRITRLKQKSLMIYEEIA
ncbi:hypothetical protein PV325_007974 [Microctonus aethiopoides]|nr:hypothetical protein PV325_007974 [Microctonus aethiopoides]